MAVQSLGARLAGTEDSGAATRATPPDWLIIVRPDRPHLLEALRRSFDSDPGVRVILDRRQGDRRTRRRLGPPGRRHGQRRKPLPRTEAAFGRNAGFLLVVRR